MSPTNSEAENRQPALEQAVHSLSLYILASLTSASAVPFNYPGYKRKAAEDVDYNAEFNKAVASLDDHLSREQQSYFYEVINRVVDAAYKIAKQLPDADILLTGNEEETFLKDRNIELLLALLIKNKQTTAQLPRRRFREKPQEIPVDEIIVRVKALLADTENQ